MKHLLPIILTLFLISGCRKFQLDKTAAEVNGNEIAPIDIDDQFFCTLPSPAEFPGGTEGWQQFLQQNLVYPANAVDIDVQGTVVVQFIVDTDGTIRDIEAISGPDELKEIAVDVLKKSPAWIPAQISGRSIKDYKRQPIIFRLVEE